MTDHRVLWANGNYWTSPIRIGAHHYAALMTDLGWTVAFVSDPISPFHFLKSTTLKDTFERARAWRNGGLWDLHQQLLYYTPFALLPHFALPLLRRQWVLDHWHRLTVPNVHQVMARQGFECPELLVLDSVNQGFWLDVIKPKQVIMRIADDLSGFKGVTPAMLEREKELIARVDVVVYTAERLGEKIRPCSPKKMVHVPNGCEVNHFVNDPGVEPDDLKSVPRPRAIYVGAIDSWFDVALFERVARSLPRVSFVIVGPPRINLESIRLLANVFVFGPRPYAQIPAYLKNSDVGLIPFQVTEMVRSVHPIKLYEYLAAGLPVVSVSWDELERIHSPARLCSSANEFSSAIEDVIAHPDAPDTLQRFAAQADWKCRLNAILDSLGSA